MAQDEQRNKINRRAPASMASQKSAKASEPSDLSGADLRRALDQEILDYHPGLTQEELDEFMNEA